MAVVSADGQRGVTATRTGEIRLWDLVTGRLLATSTGAGRVVESVAFTRDDEGVLTTGPDDFARWDGGLDPADRGDGEWEALEGGSSLVVRDRRIILSPDGQALAGDDESGAIHGWDLAGASTIDACREHLNSQRWTYSGDEPSEARLLVMCDGGRFVGSLRRDRLVVLDTGTGAVVAAIAVPVGRSTALAGHPTAPVIAVASQDGEVLWWDARTGELTGRVQAHEDRVQGLAVAAGLLLSASRDGTAALWRLDDGAELGRFAPGRVKLVAWREDPFELRVAAGSPDGTRWLVGGAGGQVHVLEWSGRLVPLRHGRPAVVGALDIEFLVDSIRAGEVPKVLRAPSTRHELYGGAHHESAAAAVADALVDAVRSGDMRLAEAAMRALLVVDYGKVEALCPALFERLPGIAGRLVSWVTDEWAPTVPWLLAQLPDADGVLATFVIGALVDQREDAVPALHEHLRAFPPGWRDIDKRLLMRTIEALSPDEGGQRLALELMLGSASPEARYIAIDAYNMAHRSSGWRGGLKPPFESRLIDRHVRDYALRELAEEPDTSRGYGSYDGQYDALYALWSCYQDEDAPVVARVLATTDDKSVLQMSVILAREVFKNDPHYDEWLIGTLKRIVANTELAPEVRGEAVSGTLDSTSPAVEPWLLELLSGGDPTLAPCAALTLLDRDVEKFASVVEPYLDRLEGWDVTEARRLLAGDHRNPRRLSGAPCTDGGSSEP